MKQKTCFIVPYFGKLPNIFTYWLNCCRCNPDFNWLIFTDDLTSYDCPENVFIHHCTLQQLKDRFEEKLGFEVALSYPYKLCDFRPLYGYLFEQELKGFSHWGYCDLDLLFGRLNKFFSEDDLDTYDKISVLGHMSLLKNKSDVNHCFQNCDYKKILQDVRNKVFDEVRFEPNINKMLMDAGYMVKPTIDYADISTGHFCFHLYVYNGGKRCVPVPYHARIFEFKNCVLREIFLEDRSVKYKEIAYVHFQKRKIDAPGNAYSNFLLVPNRIIPWRPVDREDLELYSRDNLLYFLGNTIARYKRAVTSRMKMFNS